MSAELAVDVATCIADGCVVRLLTCGVIPCGGVGVVEVVHQSEILASIGGAVIDTLCQQIELLGGVNLVCCFRTVAIAYPFFHKTDFDGGISGRHSEGVTCDGIAIDNVVKYISFRCEVLSSAQGDGGAGLVVIGLAITAGRLCYDSDSFGQCQGIGGF